MAEVGVRDRDVRPVVGGKEAYARRRDRRERAGIGHRAGAAAGTSAAIAARIVRAAATLGAARPSLSRPAPAHREPPARRARVRALHRHPA